MFIEHTCVGCFQPDEAAKRVTGTGEGCPLLRRAAAGRFPGKWKRRRNGALGETFKCEEYQAKPAPSRRSRRQIEPNELQDSLFGDVDAQDRLLVPVDGWPDYRAQERRKGTDVDHQ